ncbi:endopeptidase La [Desulforhopalus singaporensis]|uniref:Lon protease n=1 Tax=Desulforhopalus singaporensis TaxID=91360 RepID=A0A1H0LA84_9BACT|nr:endopeptidase La [Desulforhopalus singaporensis]SDO65117.1 ATP dependent PIM1 peptidase. Serine peptidase. MEROPS family S16 [Desulforhopalus singaporensis]
MAEEPTVLTPDGIESPGDDQDNREQSQKSLVVSKDLLPEKIMVIPLHDRPMFPKMMGPVIVDDPVLQQAVMKHVNQKKPLYLGLILLHPKEDGLAHYAESGDDFFKVGVVTRVIQVSPFKPGEPLQVLVQALERFDVVSIVKTDLGFGAEVKYWYESIRENTEEFKAYSVAIIDCIKELVNLNPLFKEGLSLLIERINLSDPGSLGDFAASMTTSSGVEIQKILETVDVRKRLELVLILLKNEVEISKLKAKISKRIEEQLSKQQREFFLKQQLQEIKKELGLAKDDTQAEIEKFQDRVKKLVLSEEAREKVEEEIEKLKLLGSSSPEFNVTRTYLDWLTILPWGVYSKDSYNRKKAQKILDRDHYGLDDVKTRILELISVGVIKGDLSGTILLLQGPPGVGKTSIGRSVADSLGREFFRFSLGGMRDEAEIKGHRRTYIGAMPGKFIQAIKTCKTANPVIMLDEVDKIGASFQGDPASALLEVLDPEQNRDFLDHYLDVRFDLSKIFFICTANQLDTIPGPLMDRMEVIQLPGYILEEKVEIARRHLLPRQLKAHGLTAGQVNLSKTVIAEIIDGYAREAGVRGVENCIKKILRKSVSKIIDNPEEKVRIKKGDLKDLLGKRFFSEDYAYKKPMVGVITGLAYTTMGGATLHIEAVPIPTGQPGFKQTGQLGKVMVESSEIAYSYIRSLMRDDDKVIEFFKNNLVHLHVPAGATPKDGPSAGITMASALYSLVTAQPIRKHIAMTGELTLSGLVMPIGGVKEKMIAAKRAGIQEVLLPKDNQEDFELLADHIKEGISAHFVSRFDEVRRICFK